MWAEYDVIDADSHIMEPLWLWQEYLDPAFREHGLTIQRDALDGDKLIIDGRPSRLVRRLGGVRPVAGEEIRDWNHLPAEGEYASYRESCLSESWDPTTRMAWMDDTGIDRTWLFPSLGLIWPREVDPFSAYAKAQHRAYNRWVAEMASATHGRLVPVAQMSLGAVDEITRDLQAIAAAGFRHVALPWGLRPGLRREFVTFCAQAERIGLAIHVHKVAVPHFLPLEDACGISSADMGRFFNHVNETLPGQLCLAGLFDLGIPDACPELRWVFHECNAGWVPAWLDRANESYATTRGQGANPLKHEPSHYVLEKKAFLFSTGTGERLPNIPNELHGNILMATDFPHPGTSLDPRSDWMAAIQELPETSKADIVGRTAMVIMGGESR